MSWFGGDPVACKETADEKIHREAFNALLDVWFVRISALKIIGVNFM